MTTKTNASDAIAEALIAAHSAYWAACDAAGRAIDPAELGAPDSLLNDAYEVALRLENIAAERDITWQAVRDLGLAA